MKTFQEPEGVRNIFMEIFDEDHSRKKEQKLQVKFLRRESTW